LSLILLVPAVLGIAHLLHRRIPLLAIAGAALVLVGILSLAVLHGVQLVQHQMIQATADRQQMVALLQRLEGGIGTKVIFAGLFLGLFLGWVILPTGRFVTESVPTGIPLFVLASLVLNFAGLERTSRLLFLNGLAWLGALVLVSQEHRWAFVEIDGRAAEHLTERVYRGSRRRVGVAAGRRSAGRRQN
jgi:hypothetical protein